MLWISASSSSSFNRSPKNTFGGISFVRSALLCEWTQCVFLIQCAAESLQITHHFLSHSVTNTIYIYMRFVDGLCCAAHMHARRERLRRRGAAAAAVSVVPAAFELFIRWSAGGLPIGSSHFDLNKDARGRCEDYWSARPLFLLLLLLIHASFAPVVTLCFPQRKRTYACYWLFTKTRSRCTKAHCNTIYNLAL